jgi:hypothetical protein
MTSCAHRLAASRHIRKHLDQSTREWLARREHSARRASLVKLAHTSMQLHQKALEKGIPFEDGKSPLAVACAALATIRRNQGV